MTSSAAPSRGTLSAFDPATRRVISFTDYVRDGEVVDVYRTMDAAENERGPYTRMRVAWDGVEADDDEWILEAVDAP